MHPKKLPRRILTLGLGLAFACIPTARAAFADLVRSIGGVNHTFIDYSYYAKASTNQNVDVLGRLYVPNNYDPAKSYPLVIFLHGTYEAGTDNTKHINAYLDNLILQAKARGFIVYAPQAPGGSFSDDRKNMIVQSVARALGQYSVDPTRIYATGISMGGGTLVNVLLQYPQLFAAYIPLSPASGFNDVTALQAIGKPHWYFHGWLDNGHGTSDNSVNKLVVANGGTTTTFLPGSGSEITYQFGPNPGLINYTLYTTGGHNNTVWGNGAYAKAALYDWMLSTSTPITRLAVGKSITVNFKTTPVDNDRRNPAPIAADGTTWNTIGRNGTYRAVDIAVGFAQDTAGLVTTTSFWVAKAFGNIGSSVPAGISVFGDSALPAGYWVTTTNQSGELAIRGLNPLAIYDLEVFATTTAANHNGTYTVGGQTQTLNATNNLSQLASFTSLQTDATGKLTLVVAPAPGSTNAVLNTFRLTALHPISGWRRIHFSTTADTGSAADLSDPDTDGLPNLLEYALGLDPTIPNSSASPIITDMVAPGTMSFTYQRSRSDVQYVVETSDDLVNWTSAGVDQGTPDGNGITTAQASSSATGFYMRLSVTLTPVDASGTPVTITSTPVVSLPALPTPILAYYFDDTGTTSESSGTTHPATTPTGTLTLLGTSQLAADIHSSGGLGVSGDSADRALDLTAATGMGNTSTGLSPAAKITPHPSTIGGLTSFTLQGWFKTDGTSVIGSTSYLFHVNNTGMISLRAESAGILKLYVDGIAVSSASGAYNTAATWTYFAVTYDGTLAADNVKFYAGRAATAVSLVNTATLNAGAVGSFGTQPMIIGNSAGGNRPFDGLLDNVRLFGSTADGSGVLPLADLEAFRQADILP